MGKGRIPLAQQFMSRDGQAGVKDSYVQNGYLDKINDKVYVIKRPGTTQFYDFGVVADPQGAFWFNGLFYAIYNDTLYTSGGSANIGTDGMAFTQAPVPIWSARAFFTATVFNDRIYVIGGEEVTVYADISYTADGVTWAVNASSAPFGHRQGHNTCVFNGQMWLISGEQNDSAAVGLMPDVWSTSDGANWTAATKAAPWQARVNFGLVVANNGMYIYGGQLADGTLADDVWFSVDGAAWQQLTAAATGTPRQLMSMVVFQNKLWIIGGQTSAIGITPITQVDNVASSTDGNTWNVTAPVFGVGRALMASCVYNNKIWLLGGQSGATVDSNVYSSTNGTTYTLVTTTPGFSARGGAQAVVFKTPSTVNQYRYPTIWLLGGSSGVDLQEVWRGNLDAPLNATYALSPTVPFQTYQFTTFLNSTKLVIKNQSNLWVLESGTLTKVVDANYPPTTVPGLVVLNSFVYVMTPEGEIRSCALEDPLHWPSLQFIDADYEDDTGIAIAKYYNYLIAFSKYTTQFFYDAGNPAPGIALSPYQSATIKVGCANAGTVQSTNNTILWLGQTTQRNWGVYLFDGLNPKRVSTPWVDKVLNTEPGNLRSFATGMEGHNWYLIGQSTMAQMAYDLSTGHWAIWVNASLQRFPYAYAVTNFSFEGDFWYGTGNILGGKIYAATTADFDDDGNTFDMISQTDKIGEDTLERKFCGRIDFVADITPATVTVEVTDDDYNTYQTWGTLDLSKIRPYVNRGGSFRSRAFRFTQTDSNSARWEAAILTMSMGES
jgi:hypothetical protein